MKGSTWAALGAWLRWHRLVLVLVLILLPDLTQGRPGAFSGSASEDGSLSPAAAGEVPAPAPAPPAGQWAVDLLVQDDRTAKLVVDIGQVGSRWVGEFDLIELGVENYPVNVSVSSSSVELRFAAINLDFHGVLSESGDRMNGRFEDEDEAPVEFRRTGDARFSEGFLALEAMAADASLLEQLSPDGAELRERFNREAGKTRLILLLSPT